MAVAVKVHSSAVMREGVITSQILLVPVREKKSEGSVRASRVQHSVLYKLFTAPEKMSVILRVHWQCSKCNDEYGFFVIYSFIYLFFRYSEIFMQLQAKSVFS